MDSDNLILLGLFGLGAYVMFRVNPEKVKQQAVAGAIDTAKGIVFNPRGDPVRELVGDYIQQPIINTFIDWGHNTGQWFKTISKPYIPGGGGVSGGESDV